MLEYIKFQSGEKVLIFECLLPSKEDLQNLLTLPYSTEIIQNTVCLTFQSQEDKVSFVNQEIEKYFKPAKTFSESENCIVYKNNSEYVLINKPYAKKIIHLFLQRLFTKEEFEANSYLDGVENMNSESFKDFEKISGSISNEDESIVISFDYFYNSLKGIKIVTTKELDFTGL